MMFQRVSYAFLMPFCGRPGHLSSTYPIKRVNALEETDANQHSSWLAEESENFARFGDAVFEDPLNFLGDLERERTLGRCVAA